MVAEAYNYPVSDGQLFRMDGGSRINYYAHGFDAMINFGFKGDAKQDYETLFSRYSGSLSGDLKDYSVLSYISSHDDDHPFDPARLRPFEAATKLMLSPGAAQIYYGDETARLLNIAEAKGDAKLRSKMDWTVLKTDAAIPSIKSGQTYQQLLAHWQKLGQFRRAHLAVGAGLHQQISASPYVFKRSYGQDVVVVALDLPSEKAHRIPVADAFKEGEQVQDFYSGSVATVKAGHVELSGAFSLVLLAKLATP